MKKILVFTAILLLGQPLFCQKFEKLNKQDTLYYYFKHKKNEHRGTIRPFSKDINSITFRVKIKGRMHSFKYLTHGKLNDEYKNDWIEIPPIEKERDFLKTHKNQIMSYRFLKKMDPEELRILFWNSQNKVIYLIDEKENADDKIFLRKVHWISSYLLKQ